MRIHPLCLLLLAVPALVTATNQSQWFAGCKCDENASNSRKLKIRDCDSPLYITKDALVHVFKNMTAIGFKNVIIKIIDKDAFEGFNELESIIFEDTTIDFIDSSAFPAPELRMITFTKTTFGESPILSSEYLEELIFNDCQLSQVPVLDHLPALTFLNLANNFITDIDELAFSKLRSLEEITLTNNSITKLPPKLFANNEDFNLLNLDHNPLTSFTIDSATNLELLSLRHCKLSTFDRRVTENLSLVSALDLSGNELSVLNIDVFEPMKDLNKIDLSDNKLVELDDDIFSENSKLDVISLDNNQFTVLPNFQTKGKVFQTHTFSCRNCGLTTVTGSFENMRELSKLDLSNNLLEDIDGVFDEISAIKEVILSNNKISTIGVNSFKNNNKLETLDLSNNPLLPLDPVVLASIPMLTKLNISSCGMTKLWTNHNAVIPKLEQLYVSKNELSAITVEDVKIMPDLKLIDVMENPLTCTEDLYDLLDYVTVKSIYLQEADVKTHEELLTDTEFNHDLKRSWQSVLPPDCNLDDSEDEDLDNELSTDNSDPDQTYDDADYDDDDKEDDVEASVLDTSGFNLAKASYVLSITFVFILTALFVLFLAVAITFLILKKHKAFNMHNGNLPRLKIPLWHGPSTQKKHSGSVYKQLSEDLSGPRTPIINRYDFKQTPQVHNSIP